MKNLVLFKTHLLNELIVNEYVKIKNSGIDTIMIIDNTKNLVPDNGSNSQNIVLYGQNVTYYPFTIKKIKDLGLKFYFENINKIDYARTLWGCADYQLYLMRKLYPEYDYYWQTEYDMFYNDTNYNSFFDLYKNNNADLLITYYEKADDSWCWTKNVDWIYESEEMMKCFFPILRISAKAIDYLYKRRIEIETDFEKIQPDSDAIIPNSEIFTATELTNAGFRCENLKDFHNVRCHPDIIKKEINAKRRLYHPYRPHNKKTIFNKLAILNLCMH